MESSVLYLCCAVDLPLNVAIDREFVGAARQIRQLAEMSNLTGVNVDRSAPKARKIREFGVVEARPAWIFVGGLARGFPMVETSDIAPSVSLRLAALARRIGGPTRWISMRRMASGFSGLRRDSPVNHCGGSIRRSVPRVAPNELEGRRVPRIDTEPREGQPGRRQSGVHPCGLDRHAKASPARR